MSLSRTVHRQRIKWVLAFACFAGGTAWFTVAQSTLSFWVGGTLCVLPFCSLVVDRGKRKGFDNGPPDLGDSGPWSAP